MFTASPAIKAILSLKQKGNILLLLVFIFLILPIMCVINLILYIIIEFSHLNYAFYQGYYWLESLHLLSYKNILSKIKAKLKYIYSKDCIKWTRHYHEVYHRFLPKKICIKDARLMNIQNFLT